MRGKIKYKIGFDSQLIALVIEEPVPNRTLVKINIKIMNMKIKPIQYGASVDIIRRLLRKSSSGFLSLFKKL